MKIILNNTIEELIPESLTIRELLQHKNFTFKMLVIRVNGELISKDQYDHCKIQDGDDVMILHLVSGG